MITDKTVRNVRYTEGDFVSFELSEGANWPAFRISRTALDVLRSASGLTPLESFTENLARIKTVALAQHKVGNGYTALDSTHFE